MDETKTLEERKAEIEECTRLLNELTELIGSDEVTADPGSGRTEEFMIATGKLVKCVEVLATTPQMQEQLEDLIYDVIVAAEDGAYQAGFKMGQAHPEYEIGGSEQ